VSFFIIQCEAETQVKATQQLTVTSGPGQWMPTRARHLAKS
jgi:hypothetical protein